VASEPIAKTSRIETPQLESLRRVLVPVKNVIEAMLSCPNPKVPELGHAVGEHQLLLSNSQSFKVAFSEERPALNYSPDPNELERLIRQLIESGQLDPKALEGLSGLIENPGLLSGMFANLQNMFSASSGSVNWELAQSQGIQLAKSQEKPIADSLMLEIPKAFEMASLWLQEATGFSSSETPKQLTRSMWVQDAMPLFRELSDPIATSMARALSENLKDVLPEQFEGQIGQAANFLGNAGATIFAMQLGQAAGRLAAEAIMASEVGIPLSTRAGFVPQNLAELLEQVEGSRSELMIYLATRELALTNLFAANPYLREQIVLQVREFAAGLKVDTESIQQIAEQVDLENPDQVSHVIEMSSALMARTEEQELALARIETTLALIEGWADSVTDFACRRLPEIESLSELYRRRRAVSSVSQKTFATLIGLELTPKLVRETKAMWDYVAANSGSELRDQLISHPDQLPTLEEIQHPESLINRTAGSAEFDQQLRDLLGE
jgi:putative hydrolase